MAREAGLGANILQGMCTFAWLSARFTRPVLPGGVPARSFGRAPPDAPAAPVFTSEEAGRRPRHGSSIAPPTFGAARAVQPCAEVLGDPANGFDVLRALHGDEDLSIHAVVRPGDVLETEGVIVRIDQKSQLVIVVMRASTVNQRREAVLEATSSWRGDPLGEARADPEERQGSTHAWLLPSVKGALTENGGRAMGCTPMPRALEADAGLVTAGGEQDHGS